MSLLQILSEGHREFDKITKAICKLLCNSECRSWRVPVRGIQQCFPTMRNAPTIPEEVFVPSILFFSSSRYINDK